ncbi:MAG: DUF962 domain-containing protein [Planctomycetaceae bacterium]|nr:DUF962 domain-containing protein [Planctomycetaceae bacterium]
MIRSFLNNYLPRHRHPVNQILHLAGVPLSFLVAPILAIYGYDWYVHVGCFAGGYLLQFAGHAVEGNDAGEVIFLKRMFGLPYTEYAPGSNSSSASDSSDETSPTGR